MLYCGQMITRPKEPSVEARVVTPGVARILATSPSGFAFIVSFARTLVAVMSNDQVRYGAAGVFAVTAAATLALFASIAAKI